jgi:DMSO/TMAO reductase YedYZ molybdopterin-dependent catalytic subunit
MGVSSWPANHRVVSGAIAGFLSGAVAVGVGQLVAGITGPSGSPVVEVGQLQIDLTPPALKDFAIREFGSHDKTVLVGGILVVIAILAAAFGALAMRRMAFGFAGLTILGALGLIAVATRPDSRPVDATPTIAAIAAAAVTLAVLIRGAQPLRASETAAPRARTPGGKRAAARQPALPATDPGLTRRRFLVLGGAAAGTAAVGVLGGNLLADRFSVAAEAASLRLPRPRVPAPRLPAGSDLHIPGLSSFVTPNQAFYRVDTALVLPEVPSSSWKLHIHGMVDREIDVTFDDLLRMPLVEDYITLCCVSDPVEGPYVGNAKWLGAKVATLLRQAGIQAGADQLFCTSADGFNSGTPVEVVMDGRDALLAVGMNGTPLPVAHGFPVRLVVPGLYGYVSACKWITDIEVTTYAANTAYWAQRGWSQQAPIKTESRIDVPGGLSSLPGGTTQVAGVAWAQHKGIDAVEVRIDRGPWNEARLAAVPGIDCWRQWVFDWDASSGTHLIEARATDATGYTQTAVQAGPPPNGASGYPSIQVTVT